MHHDERRKFTCECRSGTSPGICARGEFGDKIIEHALLAARDCNNSGCVTKTLIAGAATLKQTFVSDKTAWTVLTLIIEFALSHWLWHYEWRKRSFELPNSKLH